MGSFRFLVRSGVSIILDILDSVCLCLMHRTCWLLKWKEDVQYRDKVIP